jgi:hypothetical protein
MVPLIDLLNHDHDACHTTVGPKYAEGNGGGNEDQGGESGGGGSGGHGGVLQVVVEVPCYKGEQILYSYGAKTNVALLRAYGFCQFENPNETVEVVVSALGAGGGGDGGQGGNGGDLTDIVVEISHMDPLPEELIAAARSIDARASAPSTGGKTAAPSMGGGDGSDGSDEMGPGGWEVVMQALLAAGDVIMAGKSPEEIGKWTMSFGVC